MAINKVIYGSNTLIDLTEDTVAADNLLSGYTAHDRSGTSITGNVQFPVTSVNTKTGAVVLDATDVGALPDTYIPPVTSVNGQTGAVTLTIPAEDDHKWNNVSLAKQSATNSGETCYVPYFASLSAVSASLYPVTRVPAAHYIPKYDANACLISTTPSANDNSTKVATTAYVDAAITDEKVKAQLSSDDGTVRYLVSGDSSGEAKTKYYHTAFAISSNVINNVKKSFLFVGNGSYEGNIRLNKEGSSIFVQISPGAPSANRTVTFQDASGTIALVDDIPKVYSSTNTDGYLTIATLPIYDGTVV